MLSLKFISSAFLFIVLLSSCKQSPVAEALSETNKLIIHFIERGNVVKTVTTQDKNAIKKMIYAFEKGDAKQTNCEITGRMIFLNDDVELQQVDFSSLPECRYFTYNFEGKQHFSSMTNETANFLQSVMMGLDFY
jgi:hypothetical protein